MKSNLWFLAAVTLYLLLPANNIIPLIDRDEPRFAQATREMIQRDDWIIPTFNGKDRFDKPILSYWMMRGAYAVFGINEFGARFHSVASALVLVLVVAAMGGRWFSPTVGLWAGFGMATCLQMVIHGRSAVADMPMILCVALAQWAIWELLHGARATPWTITLYVSLGLGFLAKGPIALAVPALTLLLYRFAFHRRPVAWSRLKLHIGIPVVLLIVGAWGIPALIQTQGRFWEVGIGEHIVDRGTRAFSKRAFTPFYYLGASILSLYPWSAWAPAALGHAWRQRTPLHAFLLSWFIAPFVVFSLYATQLPHYVMPGYAALFLLIGACMDKPLRIAARVWRDVLLAIGVVAGAVLCLAARKEWGALADLPIYASHLVLGAGLLLSGLAVTGMPPRAVRMVGLAVTVVGVFFIGSSLRNSLPALRISSMVSTMSPDAEFACWAYREPSLVFYTDRRWNELSKIEEAHAFLQATGTRMLVVPVSYTKFGDALKRKRKSRDFTTQIAGLTAPGVTSREIRGFNVARSEFVVLRVYYKREVRLELARAASPNARPNQIPIPPPTTRSVM